ncbi:MAG TPA: YdcF family protein [Candidatus Limnocylindria bacterium]|nr:YdcF family protein [Candidatus Limnocylindria bacterium]
MRTRRLADLGEIVVVLGGGLREDGQPTPSTLARADAAADYARDRDAAVIVSGSHGNGPRPARTEAELMADRLVERGVPRDRIYLEDESRDTITNAVFVAERYLAGVSPRPLRIVTSPFHMARSLVTFELVLGPSWPLAPHPSASGSREGEHAANEALYLERTRELLAGLRPGDLGAIGQRARATLHERVRDTR